MFYYYSFDLHFSKCLLEKTVDFFMISVTKTQLLTVLKNVSIKIKI